MGNIDTAPQIKPARVQRTAIPKLVLSGPKPSTFSEQRQKGSCANVREQGITPRSGRMHEIDACQKALHSARLNSAREDYTALKEANTAALNLLMSSGAINKFECIRMCMSHGVQVKVDG